MHETTIDCTYDSPERAALVAGSVRLEAGDIDGDRTRARVARSGATVEVTVEADDLVALRAGQTTWTSLIEVADRTAALLD